MIIDYLENLRSYSGISSNMDKAIEFILNTDLEKLQVGRNEVCGDDIFANVMEAQPRTKEEAPIEIHRKYIDIQIPLTGDEVMGYTPKAQLPDAEYNADSDAALYPVGMLAAEYFNVKRSMFTVFFPQDGHAPAVTPVKLRKVIVKVAI
ncbi:MAG: YhcH/YjgK/YiaL family protein [Bacteroidaceae bacterium]|nr:YhcH/YjgK/YiaL family protein [Bacteroidaceae bacterium]MBQ3623221.1 YhcH/YjgK/YiaL family protein [Bacteroidaceae bacterium]